jgi:predicted dehydrogenase
MLTMDNQPGQTDFKRRDFLKRGSAAALLTMMGGVKLVAQDTSSEKKKYNGPKLKVGVIGLGTWGREIVNTLARNEYAEVAALCDHYALMVRRCANSAPAAAQFDNYQALLAKPEIPAVAVATPTHQHKEIVLAALKAGKHVYCEAPIAHTIEDAREIALAAKTARQQIFHAGLQLRSDPQRRELIKTFRTGALGDPVMARTQWHKKNIWRASAQKAEREKELNWRLDKTVSLGLAGEILGHHLDQAAWFLAKRPVAVSGLATTAFWKDGRDVPDTVRLVLEFPDEFSVISDATLANSFDGEYEVYYGSDSAVLLRQSDVWLFKEVDAKLLGWEVYFPKQQFYQETGIVLKVGASKSVSTDDSQGKSGQPKEPEPPETPLSSALKIFVRNAGDLVLAREQFISELGDDPVALADHLATKVPRRAAPGPLEGFQAAVTAIKANEAIVSRQRIVLKPEWFQLS